MSQAVALRRALERYNPLEKRDRDGRWSDGMPNVIAEFPAQTLTGSLTVRSTRNGGGDFGYRDIELDDGTRSVVLDKHEQDALDRAMRNEYATGPTLITRTGERGVVVARVSPGGMTENEDGEPIAAGRTLHIGETGDPAAYDGTPGVTFTNRQADKLVGTTSLGAGAGRVETGYGPLDAFANGKRQMTLRMKDDNGRPAEVTFSAVEWNRLRDAYNLVWEGFDEDNPDENAPEINTVRVRTKAGPVDVSWAGPRDVTEESRLRILPAYPADWGVIVDGPHLSDVTDLWVWAGTMAGIHESAEISPALELWRALEAWNADLHPRGPGGRFVKGLGGGGRKHSLADAVKGTAEGGPKRQRKDKAGMSVADAVRKAARTSDTTGRPTQRTDAEHRAHGAHDVADEVDRALAEAGVSESVRSAISGRARARADTHGARPGTLKAPPVPKAAEPAALGRADQPSAADHEAKVRGAYDQLAAQQGDWVGIADLREQLGGSRSEQDTAIRSLLHKPGWQIEEETNQKSLSQKDRDGAINIGNRDQHVISFQKPASRRSSGGTPGAAGDGLDRYRTTEDQYRQHYDGYTDDELADAGRVEGVETAGRSRSGIIFDLAYTRALQDRKVLEQNLAERRAGSGAGSVQTRPAGVGAGAERTEITGAWKGGRSSGGAAAAKARRDEVPSQAEIDADARARQRQGGLGSGRETGKQAWGALLAGPQKERRAEGPKPSAAQLAADRKRVADRTAATLASGGAKRGNVFANPEFNDSTGRASSGLAGAQAAHAEVVQQLAAALRSAKSRDDARSAISALNVRELRGLAEHLQLKPGSKATKTKLLDAIVDGTAGRRLDSEALGRH